MSEYENPIGVWVRNDAAQIEFNDLFEIYYVSLLTVMQPDLSEYDLVGIYPSLATAAEAINEDFKRMTRASLEKLVRMGLVEKIDDRYRLAGRVTP